MNRKGSRTNTRGFWRDDEYRHSAAEYNYYQHLRAQAATGDVADLRRGKGVRLGIVINGKTIGHYTPDAVYTNALGELVVVDVKGMAINGWAFRKKVIEAACDITITVVDANGWTDEALRRRAKQQAQEGLPL